MAGWKLRKDKTLAETPEGEAPNAIEAPDAETPQAEFSGPEATAAEAPDMAVEVPAPARTYDLGGPEETKEPAFLNAVPHFSSLDSEPEVRFTDLDFDSDPEDISEHSKNGYSEFVYPKDEHPEHGDGPLTLVDYTEPEATPGPQEFSLHGAQIFEMPPPEAETSPEAETLSETQTPPPAVEAPASLAEAPAAVIEAAPPLSEPSPFVMEASPFVMETSPAIELPAPAEEEDFPLLSRTGRFEAGELASGPDFGFGGIPTVSPFVLDTPVPAAPPAAPRLIVRVGRLSAPFALAKDVTTIGRPDSALHYYPDVEIELDDAVSRRHAEVVKRGDSYYLVDTGSTNGTLLNGEKLPPQEERLLAYGDRIRLGDRTEVTFE